MVSLHGQASPPRDSVLAALTGHQYDLNAEGRNLLLTEAKKNGTSCGGELHGDKTPEGYRQIARSEAGPTLATLAAEFLLDVRLAQHLIVLKTSPGHANLVAVALDDEEWPEVVGTLAGDDTILVITPDNATAEAVRAKFLAMLQRAP